MSWFLEHAWIVPAIPAASFVLILAIGKRLPFKGAEVGIASIGSSFVLACLTGVAWIQHVNSGGGHGGGAEEGGEHALGLLARFKVFVHGGKQAFVTRPADCHACGECVKACPEQAIQLRAPENTSR